MRLSSSQTQANCPLEEIHLVIVPVQYPRSGTRNPGHVLAGKRTYLPINDCVNGGSSERARGTM